MNPLQWALLPLRRYAQFYGRSQRAEYWWYILAVFLLLVGMFVALAVVDEGQVTPVTDAMVGGFLLIGLALVIPTLALQVRRLHDIGMSGWHLLWQFLPYIGPFVILYFMVCDGNVGDNRFGGDPKHRVTPSLASLFD